MKNEKDIRIKISQLLREQLEINPESAIAEMNKGNYDPSCRILEHAMLDIVRKIKLYDIYSKRVTEAMGDLLEAIRS